MNEDIVAFDPYTLDKDSNGLLAITEKNCCIINLAIALDSSYGFVSDPDDERSSCWWISQHHDDIGEKDVIRELVVRLDNENSTHLNAYPNGRGLMAESIFAMMNSKDSFFKRLGSGDSSLVVEMARGVKGRNNFSFATKFCTYLARFYFSSAAEKDRYSIYDGIIGEVLPYYAWYYKADDDPARFVARKNSKIGDLYMKTFDYQGYRALIDEVRKASSTGKWTISREYFDNLLWYYYKGRPRDLRTALDLVVSSRR